MRAPFARELGVLGFVVFHERQNLVHPDLPWDEHHDFTIRIIDVGGRVKIHRANLTKRAVRISASTSRDNGVKLDIMYRRPATSFNEKLAWQYEQNILSVMEEVWASDKERIDVVIPLIHGENGEDGSLQGLLQIAGLPFVGSGVAASSACMDKSITKLLIRQAGVRQADWQVIPKQRWSRKQEACMDEIEAAFTYPVFVKPAGTGSSVGISKAKCREDLEQAVTDALRYGNKALVEEFIDGQEIEVAVLGNESPCASVCGEIDAGAEFYDYEAKYLSSSASFYVPARISEDISEQVRETAVKVYRAMECRGMARVDFFVRRDDQEVVFNEINTIPGFTSISMYPRLFAASGIEYPELIDNLIALALEE